MEDISNKCYEYLADGTVSSSILSEIRSLILSLLRAVRANKSTLYLVGAHTQRKSNYVGDVDLVSISNASSMLEKLFEDCKNKLKFLQEIHNRTKQRKVLTYKLNKLLVKFYFRPFDSEYPYYVTFNNKDKSFLGLKDFIILDYSKCYDDLWILTIGAKVPQFPCLIDLRGRYKKTLFARQTLFSKLGGLENFYKKDMLVFPKYIPYNWLFKDILEIARSSLLKEMSNYRFENYIEWLRLIRLEILRRGFPHRKIVEGPNYKGYWNKAIISRFEDALRVNGEFARRLMIESKTISLFKSY